ncbi:unnamed protein product, partial [Polarella glacialis]
AVRVERLLVRDYRYSSAPTRIVKLLRQALVGTSNPEKDWRSRAKFISAELAASVRGDEDGVAANARAVYSGGTVKAAVLRDTFSENRGWTHCMGRQARCCFRCTETFIIGIIFMGVPTLLYVFLLCVFNILCCGPCRRRSAGDIKGHSEDIGKELDDDSSDIEVGQMQCWYCAGSTDASLSSDSDLTSESGDSE